ncbi:MAG: hypothetical protein KDD76_05760, partial [Rickettsiales bacterium]|nr:hypothetical protein [Rickettsiales bacterium]
MAFTAAPNITARATPMWKATPMETLLQTHAFLSLKEGVLHVKPGEWTVTQPIIPPAGIGMIIPAGTTLHFSADSYLYVRGPLQLEGTNEKPVILAGIDDHAWQGLAVVDAKGMSRWRYAKIFRTDFTRYEGRSALTGGITFYRSNVDMNHVRIKGSRAEDALNIIHSHFTLHDVAVSDTLQDAIDSDFSTGEIKQSQFEHVLGDAIDTSGSTVKVENSTFTDIGDKALSVGENSNMTARGLVITQAETGIASKDASLT